MHYVSDLAAAVSFYEDTLGLTLGLLKVEWNWAEFEVPPLTLVLFGDYPGAPLKSGQTGGVALALAVEDLAAAVAELRENGAPILDGPRELSGCFTAMIADPDGNPIFLHQRKDGSFG